MSFSIKSPDGFQRGALPGLFDDVTGRQPEPIRVLVAMLIPKEGVTILVLD